MPLIESVTALVTLSAKEGISTVFAFLFAVVYISTQYQTNKVIMKEFEILKSIAGKTVLTPEQTTGVFRSILNTHIRRKVLFVKQKLIANSLSTRRKQIELAVSSEFKKITQEEAQFLSTFKTPAGDVGLCLMEVLEGGQWDYYMEEMYTIIFSSSTIEQKLEDLSSYMGNMVNDMILKIESKM